MRSFVEFIIEQAKAESALDNTFNEDYKVINDNCDLGTLGLVWFTASVKLAIEANNPNSTWGARLNPWKYEVDAMLTAFYRANYITAMEYCEFRKTFYNWMQCNYRASKPFKVKS